jgi:cation diffusion facilitator family transporter
MDREREIYKVTLIGGAVNILLLVFKFVAGALGHSSAMVSDAIHSLSDFVTDIIVLLFVKISSKPQDKSHDYGHGKYETLALTVIGIALMAVAISIIVKGAMKIAAWANGEVLEAPGMLAFWAAVVSIVLKEAVYRYSIIKAKKLNSKALEANAWHHRSDALSSIGTAVGIGGAIFLGQRWTILDPIASVVVGAFIVKVAFDLLKNGIGDLMEQSLPDKVEDEILKLVAELPGISEPHELRTRRIGNHYAIELHILMDGDISLKEAHDKASEVEDVLRQHYGEETHVAVHVEPKEPTKSHTQKTVLAWLFLLLSFAMQAQTTDTLSTGRPIFVNEGETTIYHISRDPKARQGTISDALQNLPGVKVDTEGNISLRGVSEVELFINNRPSRFDEESQKNYLQQIKAHSIVRIEVMTNPSAQFTSAPDTGVINIITDSEDNPERHLSIGFQSNTRPNVSPWVSYIWNNKKWSFDANLKGGYSGVKKHSKGYSYSFVDHFENGIPNGLDTTSSTRYYRNDIESNYEVEAFFKAEYRPNRQNDFTVYFGISPSKTKASSSSNTYRKEYIDDIGEYDYSIQREDLQCFSFGATGIGWQHRFAQPNQSIGIFLNSEYDFGKGITKDLRNFKNHPNLNRDIINTNDFTDIGCDVKVEYTHPYRLPNAEGKTQHHGEIYLSLTNVLKPDNNIGLYDTLSTDGYVTDWNRSENRRFSTNKATGTLMVLHHIGHSITIKPGISWEYTWIKSHHLDTPQYDTLLRYAYWRPSLHISYRTPSMHNFSFSYTRKTYYPWGRYFTRKKMYAEESFSIGNPSLKPTLIDIFELSWAKYADQLGSISVKGYFNNSINAINMVGDVAYDSLWNRVVPFSIPVNLNKYYEAGGEFNLTYRPSPTFNVRLETNAYNSHIETYYDKTQDSLICSNMWSYNLRLGTWVKLWNKLELHATAYYNSPTQTLFATHQTAYGIDCGLRADFFDSRLSFLFNAFDIFNWNKEDDYTYNPYFISYESDKVNSRYISLELIYRIW